MTSEALRRQFDVVADAPDGVKKLRELILQLAVRGKLVAQDPGDEPASVLLARIAAEKERLVAEGKIGMRKALPPISEDEERVGTPEGWIWERFGNATDVSGGVTKGRKLSGREMVSLPYLRVANVQRGQLDLSVMKEIDIGVDELARYQLAIGDLLMTEGGDWDKVGRAAIWTGDIAVCVHQNHVFRARPYSAGPLSSWLELQANSPDGKAYFQSAAKQTTNLASINMTQLRSWPCLVPPLAEQHRIVAKVDELMALCDELEARQRRRDEARARLNRSALHHLASASYDEELAAHWERLRENFHLIYDTPESVAELRQAVLQLAVRGKLVTQDPDDEPASVLLERIAAEGERLVGGGRTGKPRKLPPIREEDTPFEVPEGWAWVRLRAISDQRLGKILDSGKNKGELYPYLRNTNVQWLRFELDDVKQMRFRPDELDEYEVAAGDLLICEGGEPGRCAVWGGSDKRMMFQKALHRVRPKGEISVRFILHSLRAHALSGALDQHFTGATIKHLTGQSLAQLPLPLAPLAEQRRIVAKVDALMALCDELESRLSRARESSARLAASVVHCLTMA